MASNQSSNIQNSSLLKVQILIVDDDSTSLSIVSAMLKTCSFNDERKLELTVVTVKNPFDALSTLRLKRGVFDLVVTDLHMPEMDGMELQKQVDEEFKLPVIIMSSDDSENVILKSLEGGAAFYIVKPANKDDLKNVWQYAVATKTGNTLLIKDIAAAQEPSSSTLVEKTCIEEVKSATSMNDEKYSKIDGRKRNRPPKRTKYDQEVDSLPAPKKAKVVWTNSLHNRFLQAINHIGLDKAVPKKILEFMSVPGLSRENVASHLQKYRIFLKKVAERGSSSSKSLSLRTLRSTFAASQPSLIFRNVHQDQYRQFPRQLQAVSRASIQPSFGGSILSPSALSGSNSGRLLSANQQAPSNYNNSMLQSSYNQSCSFGNPITSFQASQTRSGGGVLESNMSSRGHGPNGISGISTMQMYQPQNQARLSTLQNGSSPHNRFGPVGIQASNNHGYGVGSFGNINNSLINNNNNYAGIRVTTSGQLIGGGQTGGNSGMMNLAQNGNMNNGACMGINIASVSNYMSTQRQSFSTGFESGNQFPPTSFGGIYQGNNNIPMLPPLPPQQLGVRNGGQNDYAFGLMNNTLAPIFGTGNFNNQQQQLGQGELNVNDMILEPTNNLPAYQPPGVDQVSSPLHELLNPDFFNSLHIDDNTPWNEQPSSQVQNGEGATNPVFGGNASSKDGYFPNLGQQRGNDEPMDSEFSGHYPIDNGPTRNQDWDDDFLESLFGNEPFSKE